MAPKDGGRDRSETPYYVSGKTNPDSGRPSIHDVNCPSGQYIEAGPNSRGTIFDALRIDLNIPPGVLSTFEVKSSVEWNHVGSRLVTAIELGFENKSLYPNPEPYAATVDWRPSWHGVKMVPWTTTQALIDSLPVVTPPRHTSA